MSTSLIEDAEQGPLLAEARKLVVQVRTPSFALHVAQFGQIAFDVLAWANQTELDTQAAEQLRATRVAQQVVYERESKETRAAIDEMDEWYKEMVAALDVAELDQPEAVGRVKDLLLNHDASADSFLTSTLDFSVIYRLFDMLGDVSSMLLSPEFITRGRELLETMRRERDEADAAMISRGVATVAAHLKLDAVRGALIRYDRVRTLAMIRLKVEIPGFDLTVIRGAAANPRPRPAAPTTPATTPDTGLV
jgi:hypothetical protein